MNNKKVGNEFEEAFADILSRNGFWVHIFQDNKNGQPCDVIAARNGHTYLFDCKNCEGNFFILSRMEENQYNAMRLFELTGNSRGKFAVRFSPEEIYLLEYWTIKSLIDKKVRRLDRVSCVLYGHELSKWISRRNDIEGWDDKDANSCWK